MQFGLMSSIFMAKCWFGEGIAIRYAPISVMIDTQRREESPNPFVTQQHHISFSTAYVDSQCKRVLITAVLPLVKVSHYQSFLVCLLRCKSGVFPFWRLLPFVDCVLPHLRDILVLCANGIQS